MTGLHPSIWGPSQWSILHYMAAAYPADPTPERMRSMLGYITNMCSNLPCDTCSAHCQQYIRAHPPKVESAASLFSYLVDFHNSVNVKLHKRLVTEKEVRDQITTLTSRDKNTLEPSIVYRMCHGYGLGLSLFIVVICVIVAVYSYFGVYGQL
jgi:hypothetical protein